MTLFIGNKADLSVAIDFVLPLTSVNGLSHYHATLRALAQYQKIIPPYRVNELFIDLTFTVD
jgi:hypothetical protein